MEEQVDDDHMEWEEQNQNQEDDNEDQQDEDDSSQIPRNADGSLDGGVALPPESSKASAVECDLMLFLECVEQIDGYDKHPVLSPGVTVCIGLDKSTKLGAVFDRYVAFANEQNDKAQILLRVDDVEFVHCMVLHRMDTAEASALMKNDRIRVQKTRRDERALEAEAKQLQREADLNYFDSLRSLMTDLLGSCDILLDCRGKLVDENGLNQEVLRTTLRGHSSVLSKRCSWLRRMIQNAREDLERKSVVTIPDTDTMKELNHAAESDDGDDGIEALPYPAEAQDKNKIQGATEIENDEDEDEEAQSFGTTSRSSSPVLSSSSGSNLLWVTIPNHPPEAVKILLEYCYTNSVIPLGQEAFEVAWKLSDSDNKSPPKSTTCRRWSEKEKHPTVSFATAMAGIALAEEASLPRLSLMCEVAASNLVESRNVVEALTMCSKQEAITGNPLKRLRKAAMGFVLKRRGMENLFRTQTFKRALGEPERNVHFVPSLLLGTMEAMPDVAKPQKSTAETRVELSNGTYEKFEELDKEDAFHREMERRKHRAQRRPNPLFVPDEEVSSSKAVFVKWEPSPKNSKKALKRSSHSSWGKQSRHARKSRKVSRGDKWTMKKLS